MLACTNHFRPAGPKEVIVTGTFDEWNKTLPLVKQTDGSFELTVPLPSDKDILYKYVVDGEWLTSGDETKGNDENGIENNVLSVSALSASSAKNLIPESALPISSASGAAAAGPDVSATVMPKEEMKQQTLGEPGIFVPKDPEALAAFETVRDVDPKTLNEPQLTAEEKQKQKKKLKRTQYKARQKQKKAAAAAAGGATTTTASETETTPSPENAEGVFSSEVEPETTNDEQVPAKEEKVSEEAVAAAAAAPVAAAAAVPEASVPEAVATPVEEVATPVEEVAAPVEEKAAAPISAAPETLDPAVVGAVAPGSIPVEHHDAEETTEDPVAVAAALAAIEEPVPTPKAVEAEVPEVAAKEVDALPVKKTQEEEDIIVTEGGKSAKEISKKITSATGKEVEEINPSAAEAKRLTEEAKKTKANTIATKNESKSEGKEKKKGFFSKIKRIFK